ncbi:uncharacterized protein B0I36DRAFT_100631 [Microdochium trichocladiopsis]|uniref:Uncharacterized protein n=1 Tax=Microdochium trichocladiopsis TaxID=1682393 RepID=A0A9P9BUZ3_9PEZI|nr:uncharacterized protein B0I36DRAFT_100631 [Microdochium trichocladiopsis]KAH7032787.1 hypothetical protein B0I36DRAFT_100631 [Microdochium trichocladiopsis]
MSTITSTFNYCTPPASTTTVVSTVYTTTLPAACETGYWDATYVITDYCYGSCEYYQYPVIPPGFGVTTVHCPVCPTPEYVITCPTTGTAKPTGPLPPPVITGNGVTITCDTCGVTPTVTIYESEATEAVATTYPPGPVVVGTGAPVYPPVVVTTGTQAGQTNPPVVIAGAPSVSRSLGLISGLAVIAGYIYLL